MLKIATIFKKVSSIKETPAQIKKNVDILSPSLNQNSEPDLLTVPQLQNLTSSSSSLSLEENQNLKILPDVIEELNPSTASEMVKEKLVKKNRAETNLSRKLNGKLNREGKNYPPEEKKNSPRTEMHFDENREFIPNKYKHPPSPFPRKRRKITSLKKDNRKMTGNVNIYICSESTENPVNTNQQSKKNSLKTSSETTITACASNDTSYFSSTDTASNKLLKNQPQDPEKAERGNVQEDFSAVKEKKIESKLLCLCNKSKKDTIYGESSSDLVCLCDNVSFNDRLLKPSELSGSEDSISSGLKVISSHAYNRESSLKSYERLRKNDSQIFCRFCDFDEKSVKNDEFKEERVDEKRDFGKTDKVDEAGAGENKEESEDNNKESNKDESENKNQEANKDENKDSKQDLVGKIKIIDEGSNPEKNVEEKECSKEIETSLITRDQIISKKIHSPRNSPNLNNYRRFVKKCSPEKKGLDIDVNQNLSTVAENISDNKKETLTAVETSVPKYVSAFQKRNLIPEACAAKQKIPDENLQEEKSKKSALLHQSLQKAQTLLLKSKLGIAIARRRGLNYFNKEDYANLDSKEEQKADDTREDKKISDSKEEIKIEDLKQDQNADNFIDDEKTQQEDKKISDSQETKNLQDSNTVHKEIPQECDCCSCNKSREGKSHSSPKNFNFQGNLQRSRIRCCYHCEKLETDHFSPDKSKMKIRCCCHKQTFKKYPRQVEVDNDQSIHYQKSPNMSEFVCRCQGSPKSFHKNVKYSKICRPLCVCFQKTNEKVSHQNLIEKCSYCNLSTNICNCEYPLETVDSEEELNFFKKSAKTKPYGSEILPYQRLSVFSDVMSELQQKISGSMCCYLCRKEPCCCYCCLPENVGGNEKRKEEQNIERKMIICPAIQKEHSIIEKDKRKSLVQSDNNNYIGDRNRGLASRICDICRTSPCRCRRFKSTHRKQLKAKCYYCKNCPCTCVVSKEESTHKLCSCCKDTVLFQKDLRPQKLSPKNREKSVEMVCCANENATNVFTDRRKYCACENRSVVYPSVVRER